MDAAKSPPTVAAVDLGSNSFHLLIAQALDQELRVLDRVREPVCLAAGIDSAHRITEAAQRSALDSLERIGQRVRHLPPGHVRAVGTNTLRVAKNAREFLGAARQVLGHPIEVISGQEEARLIYLGVAHGQFSSAPRLVVDIGGGSTEVILGEEYEILRAHSLFMGSVTWSRRFFPEGLLTRESFRAAEIAARLELRTIEGRLRGIGWDACVGASGTVNAIRDLLVAGEWSGGNIELAGLKRLRKALIAADSLEQVNLPGLKPERARVLPGGLAILLAVFRSLGVESMSASSGALREGVLYDLVGRMRHADVRDATIQRLVRQYDVDLAQAARVERSAHHLLRQVRGELSLEAPVARKLLTWAARLHEIGLAVSHTGFHKHGAYLVTHSDMPGFSADDQSLVAALIGGHRRKLVRPIFAGVPANLEEPALRLCVLFRLAVLLNRTRLREVVPAAHVAPDWSAITLGFPGGWMKEHPLTVADLEQESQFLRAVDMRLVLREDGERAAEAAAAGPTTAAE